MTIGERLVAIRKAQKPKMNQAEFAQTIGMSRSAYSMYEIDKVEPTDTFLKLVCMTFDVNWLWLKNGDGDMKNPPDTADEMVNRIMTGENEFKKSVFRAFARLGDSEWEALKRLYEEIKKECG